MVKETKLIPVHGMVFQCYSAAPVGWQLFRIIPGLLVMIKIAITANKFSSSYSGSLSKRCKSCYIWIIFNVKLETSYSHGPRYLLNVCSMVYVYVYQNLFLWAVSHGGEEKSELTTAKKTSKKYFSDIEVLSLDGSEAQLLWVIPYHIYALNV